MRSVSSLLDIFKICVYIPVAIFITLIRGYVISSSSIPSSLFVSALVLIFLFPAHKTEKDKSLLAFFFTILSSVSYFDTIDPPLIVYPIVLSLIATIQRRLQRFRGNRHSSSSSPSNNIDWSLLPLDLVTEKDKSLTAFFFTILTSVSYFDTNDPPLIVILIVLPLIATIQRRLQRFRANRHSSSSSPSNNIDWSLLPQDLVTEKDKSLTAFFFTILTSVSYFDTIDPPLIVTLIVLSLIATIQRRLQRFRANRHSSSSSPSNNIDWSLLPLDLVQLIVDGMATFKNYIAANGVSRDWRSVFSSISRGPQLPLPVLMLSEPLLTDMRTLFSLYDHSRHRLQLSEVRGKRIWGSQHGWVVTLGSRYVTQLVHLMTGKRINLAQLDTIRRLAPREEWFRFVQKFILLKEPSDEPTFLVIAIFGPMNSLAFSRVRLGAALNRRGEGEWVVVVNPENLKFKDVVHFNGQIYALCDNGKLVRFEPVAPFANMVQVIADHPQDAGAYLKIYLVESLGNLYGVFRNGFLIPSERRFETTSFFVYKFNFNASAWEEVTHLEGQTFFVGDGNSFSRRFPTSIIPSRSDCIYFTDDHWVWRKFPRKAYGGHDVGLFDMATRDILPLKFGKDKPRFYSRPILVTRNDKL